MLDAPSLSAFKRHLDNALKKVLFGQAVALQDHYRSLPTERVDFSFLLYPALLYSTVVHSTSENSYTVNAFRKFLTEQNFN